MLAARELNVEKLPGEQPQLDQREADLHPRLRHHHEPGQRLHPGRSAHSAAEQYAGTEHRARPNVTRPEIYFGELTNTDVYVKTRQKEFNYPARRRPTASPHTKATAASCWAVCCAACSSRSTAAISASCPSAMTSTAQSRLLMRRNIRERVAALAPFLTFDHDPYIVLGDDGRLSWMMDAFTTSDSYPYSTHYRLGDDLDQLHAEQRQGGDRRLRRHDDVLCLRHRRSDHRGLSQHFSQPVQGRRRRCPPDFASTCAILNCCSKCRRRSTACIT